MYISIRRSSQYFNSFLIDYKTALKYPPYLFIFSNDVVLTLGSAPTLTPADVCKQNSHAPTSRAGRNSHHPFITHCSSAMKTSGGSSVHAHNRFQITFFYRPDNFLYPTGSPLLFISTPSSYLQRENTSLRSETDYGSLLQLWTKSGVLP